MTVATSKKTIYINKDKVVNSALFDEVRLTRGLSRFRLALEIGISPQTVRRVLADGDPRPSTVKQIGEYLEIPAKDWYIKRETKE